MSARTGSRLADTTFQYLAEGAYGTIFVDRAAGRIRKIYRLEGRKESHCREVFDSEWQSLTIATADPALAPHVIGPVARISDYKVLDASGADITSQFLTDAGFEAAFAPGTFYKIGETNAGNAAAIRNAFRAVGINHTIDASVTLDGDGNIDKMIDFGMRDIELMWEPF